MGHRACVCAVVTTLALIAPVSVPVASITCVVADPYYATAGPMTSLREVSPAALAGIGADPLGVCDPVSSLVIHPDEAGELGPERFASNGIRPAAAIVQALLALDPSPLHVPREPAGRVVGTCRHFAVLSCALLRFRGISARARCGFATYFQPGLALDHWIVEYQDASRRWVRVDAQVLGQRVVDHPEDLPPGAFLTGGEAWSAYREDRIDAATCGVYGTENFGQAEIRGNAIRDLAALNKVETLPWDEWGRMAESYRGATGAAYDELIDTVAAVCAADDPDAVAGLYAREELRVPAELSR
jgi:Transglutaminase-like superfamily